MEQLDQLIQNNKVTIFDNNRLNEPLIMVGNEMILITDYIFHYHSYKDTQIYIKSHFNDGWFAVNVNTHIQRLKNNDIHDLEADSMDVRIKLRPLEILDEIMNGLIQSYDQYDTGRLLNVLDDYITYIDFLIQEKLDDYTQQKDLLFIENDNEHGSIEYHRLKLDGNQLKRDNNELIDIGWFVDVVGVNTNELKLLESINTQFL